MAVVDPGVGSPRRAVAIRVGDDERVLVGPDNGLLGPAVAAQLLWFFPDLGEHVNLLLKNEEFVTARLLQLPPHPPHPAHAHPPLAVMLVLTQLSVGAFVLGAMRRG